MPVNIFVYGTLKTGEPNHYWFQEASANDGARVDLVGGGITLEKLPLIVATEFNIPMLLGWLINILNITYERDRNCSDFPGVGLHIKGEVYTIDEKVLDHLGKIISMSPDLP